MSDLPHESGMRFLGMQMPAPGGRTPTEVQLWAAIDEDWTAFFRVAIAPGLPVVEMRVFPNTEHERDATEWNGDPAAAPPTGIPVRKVKAIRLTEVQQHAEHLLESDPRDIIANWLGSEFVDSVLGLRGEDGRKVDPEWTTPQRLAALADDYVALVNAGDPHPNARLAELWGRTPSQITTDIYHARHRYQLLTQAPGRGEAGGRLTKKAEGILERMKESDK